MFLGLKKSREQGKKPVAAVSHKTFADREEEFFSKAKEWNINSSEEETEILIKKSLKYFTPSDMDLQSRTCDPSDIRLILTGTAIGDAAGEPYEGIAAKDKLCDNSPDLYKRIPLITDGAHITDDTVLSYAIAEAALTIKRDKCNITEALCIYENALRKYVKAFPGAGYGSHFSQWAFSGKNDPRYKSFANGGAMRSGVIGAVFESTKDVITQAVLSALPTHSHPEGIKGAVITAVCVYMGLHGISKSEIVSYIQKFYDKRESRYQVMPADNIRSLDSSKKFTSSQTAKATMSEAAVNLNYSDSFESCIRNIFRYECDADTIGAITGAISAVIYGSSEVDRICTKYNTDRIMPEKLTGMLEEVLNAVFKPDTEVKL